MKLQAIGWLTLMLMKCVGDQTRPVELRVVVQNCSGEEKELS